MICLKTQIEIRFTSLLSFRMIYKPLVAPYTKHCKFEVMNIDTYKEYIVMLFKDEGYLIDLRWDRIIYIADGRKDNLFANNGPLYYFMTIFDKLKAHAEFGEVQNVVFAQWNLLEISETEAKIANNFRKQYLISMPILNDYQYDLGIAVDYRRKEDLVKLVFGPFRPKTDIETHKLTPISSREVADALKKNGIFSQVISIENYSQPSLSTFKQSDRQIAELLKQIQL